MSLYVEGVCQPHLETVALVARWAWWFEEHILANLSPVPPVPRSLQDLVMPQVALQAVTQGVGIGLKAVSHQERTLGWSASHPETPGLGWLKDSDYDKSVFSWFMKSKKKNIVV